MSIRAIALAASAAASVLAAFPAAAACSLKTQPIPVTMLGAVPAVANGLPAVDVKVNGKATRFVLDSSSAVNEIKTRFAAGQKLAPAKAANAAPEILTVPRFELAGAVIANAPFVAAERVDGDMDGVIGQTFLSQMDVEYDLAGGKVLLAKAEGCGDSNMAYWAKDGDLVSAIPLAPPADGAPLTEAKILVNGAVLTALFDTAAPFSAITQAAAEKAGVKTTDAGVKPMRGVEGQWIGDFTVNVGGEEIKNAPLMIARTTDTYYDVLIGSDYFLTHRLYVANSQHRIYATRAATPPGAPSPAVFTAHQPEASGMDNSAASRGRLQ